VSDHADVFEGRHDYDAGWKNRIVHPYPSPRLETYGRPRLKRAAAAFFAAGARSEDSRRQKRKFLESALSWPLNTSKLFYSSACATNFIDRLKMEMRNFPVWHDDAINMWAYLPGLLKDYTFGMAEEASEAEKRKRYAPKEAVRGWMSI
jgi:hypothetical protein